MPENDFTPPIIPITNNQMIDLTGKRFGMLVVLGYAGNRLYGKHKQKARPLWLCACDCGKQALIVRDSLASGATTSCGCFRSKTSAETNKRLKKTHGKVNTPEYAAWHSMKGRCCNPNDKSWLRYGGRGIVVCDRWRTSFENFLADLGLRPSAEYSLDRLNNDGNYEPDNVAWRTVTEQANNRRTSTAITYNDETHTVSEWSAIVSIHRETLWTRIYELGWSIEKAFTEPAGVYRGK